MKVLGETAMPAHIESVPHFVEFVTRNALGNGFTDERAGEIELALKEALDNIFRFSCNDGDYEVKISCNSDNAGRLVVIISDNGRPFNMLLEADPFMTPEAGKPSDNRPSTKIMKRLIRNIEYKRLENKNVLVFTVPGVLGSGS